MYKWGAVIAVILFLFAATKVTAQSDSSLTGSVVDEHGSVVGGVTVTLWQQTRSFVRSATTDDDGTFRFANVAAGVYKLSARGRGFASLTREVALETGATPEVSLVLSPAKIAEEIVVAGNRIADTPEELKRVPGAVEYVDPKTLENAHVFNFAEALRKVAGVQVRDDEGFGTKPHISIRGVNPTRSTKVLLLEDGIPLAYAPYGDNSSYYHPPIERYESIEIVKGSGQVLFGPVTVAGVVNYITPNPPDKPSGYVALTGGNRDFLNGHVNYGGTWRGIGLMFDYMRKQGEGARENIRSGLNDFNFKSLTSIGSRQALTMRLNYYTEDSNVTYSGLTEEEFRSNPRGNPFRNDFFYGDRWGASGTHAIIFNKDVALMTNIYGSYFRRHWWRQSSNSGQRPNDAGDPECGGMANLNTTCGNEGRLREYYNYGVEPRLRVNHALFGSRNETDLGFRIHFENQDRRQVNGERPLSRTGVIVEDNQRKNQAYSGFVQNRFIVSDKLVITPGVRLEHIRYNRTNRLANGGAGVAGDTNLTQWVPGVGVSYSPADRLTVFVGVHRGFAPPRTEDIINNSTGGVIELDPELSWNYEAGIRALLHAGLRVDATYFRMDYENQIVPASVAGGLGATLTNGGATLHQGFEMTARVDTAPLLRSSHNFYARSAYTYLPDAKFTDPRFSNIPGFASVSVTGNRIPYAPEHVLNFSVGYSNSGGFDAFIEAVRVGDQFGDDLNTISPTPDGQRGLVPGYTVWNATASYRIEALRASFFVTVKNLTNDTFIVDRTRGILAGIPRLVQTGFKYRF